MDRRKKLEENYENAVFALLMYEVGRSESEKIENEFLALQEDSDFTVPEDFDRRCKKTIDRHFASERRHKAGHASLKVLNRIAVAVLICILLFSTAFAVSPTLRENTLNLVIEVFETNTTFRFHSNSVSDTEEASDTEMDLTAAENITLSVGWLPDGFTLETEDSDSFMAYLRYTGENDQIISIDTIVTDGSTATLDSEDAIAVETMIQGGRAWVYTKGTHTTVAWLNADETYFTTITGENVDADTLLEIANHISIE